MPYIKSDPYTEQISSNIFKLTNLSPISFEIKAIFELFNQPALLRFFEQHQKLGHDIAPFVFAMLVHVAVMLDGVELFNPDGTGFLTSMNLFLHLIGEPGTNKSGLFRTFNNSINVLKKMFHSFFSKHIEEIINGKKKETTIDLIANNETELSLYQRLSKRENVFISTDELDVINNRFGVYLAGAVDNDVKTVGSKLLCQGYDTIKNASRTTGSSSFFIERGSINIFGASTGNMLSSVCRQYNSNVMSDGAISRYLFVTTSAHKTANDLPSEILSVQPNIVHILIVVRLLAQYKPIFVFGEYPSQNDLPTSVTVPLDIEEARQNISNPIPITEPMSILKPSVVVTMEKTDEEQDGSILSPYNAIRRIMEFEYQKSLQTDMNGSPIYTPLQRAFQRKSSTKLARLAGLCQTISYAIQLCTECINMVRFGDGLYLKESIDNEQLIWLKRFHNTIDELIKRDIAKAPKYGSEQRPLLLIGKAAIHASEMLYQYNASTVSALFNDTSVKIINKPSKTDDNCAKNDQISKDQFFEEQAILLKMASPILLKAWFNNPITGLPFTNLFVNYRKSKEKTLKLTQAIDQLVTNGILQKGIKDTRHIVTARKETYLKTAPAAIRHDTDMLNYLQSIGISIDNYEHVYLTSPLPMNMELTTFTVDLILSDNDYLEFCHLFNDSRIQQQMEHHLSKNKIQYRMSFGRKQYYMPSSSSQIIEHDHGSISNSQGNNVDETQDNNNLSSTFIQPSRRSITNLSPTVISSSSQNSTLYSEIRHLTVNSSSINYNFVDQMVAETEPNNRFEHDGISLVDDTLKQLCNMIDPCLSNTDGSTRTSGTSETISHESVPHHLNSLKEKGREQQQSSTRLESENIELSPNNNNNDTLSIETTSHNTSTFLTNINSQQTLELISELVRKEKHALKRILEQENDEFTSKRLRNNEYEDVTLSNFDFNLNPNGPFSSTHTQMQLNSSTGANQIINQDYHNSIPTQNRTNSILNSSSNVTLFPNIDTSSVFISDIIPVMPTLDTLFDDMPNENENTLYISNNDTNLKNVSNSSSIDSTITITSSTIMIMDSTDQQVNIIDHSTESNNTNNQEKTIVDQQDVNDTNLAKVYEKLILSNSIVMSKSEICIKLKHVTKVSTLRDKIISTLINDKLLIEGNWFAVKRADGSISLMSGYLKAFPKDDIQDQQDFARLLTKYGIHYHDFEQSFKRKKSDLFPRTLTASDVKYNNSWLFSTELADVIEKNSFLYERISLEPSAFIQGTNVSSTLSKRDRKAQRRYSPSDNK